MVRDMLRRCYACVVVLTFGCTHLESRGVEIAIEFTGTVSAQFDPLWQRLVPEFAPVTGRFVFDTSSIATHSTAGCDCTGYAQNIVNGFSADIGGVAVRADKYLVEINNDIDQGGGALLDFLTVRWESGLTPALTSPVLVEDLAATTGQYSVNLGSGPDLFSNSALPSQLGVEQFFFPSPYNTLSDFDPIPGGVDVLFQVDSAAIVSFRPGDFNFDDDIDGADFLKWQRTFHDPAGLAAWRGDFGADGAELSLQAAAPELDALSLAAIAAMAAAGRCVRAARATRCATRT
jgi:hypothetical protein